MKMPDGGFRPAYNVQVVTDTGSRAIVEVDVTTVGSDKVQSGPLRGAVVCAGVQCDALWQGLIDGLRVERIGDCPHTDRSDRLENRRALGQAGVDPCIANKRSLSQRQRQNGRGPTFQILSQPQHPRRPVVTSSPSVQKPDEPNIFNDPDSVFRSPAEPPSPQLLTRPLRPGRRLATWQRGTPDSSGTSATA